MAEVKIDQSGQLTQFDATISFSGDEVLDALWTDKPIALTVPVAQFARYGLKLTAQLVALPAAESPVK